MPEDLDAETDDASWAEREFDDVAHDYERVPIPEGKESERYTAAERRAELYQLIRESGHPAALSVSQRELGNRYDVAQQTISRDIEELRLYRSQLVGEEAIAHTEFVAERAVRGELEEGNYARALHAQLEYNEFLFDIGQLDREPESVEFSGDPGEAYLAMLRETAAEEAEAGEEPLHDEMDYSDEGVGEFQRDAW